MLLVFSASCLVRGLILQRVGFGSASPPPDRAFAASLPPWHARRRPECAFLQLDRLRHRNAEGFSFGFELLRPSPATGSKPRTEAAWTIRGRMTASLLHFLSDGLLRPPAKRRIEDAMLSADFVECDVSDYELRRQVRHRLGPDEFVKFFTREDSGNDHPFQNAHAARGAIEVLLLHGSLICAMSSPHKS
ncbi:hypothetical protein [Methylocella tundrae]|uniref:hypothetical protein n=1 Tax=Methylocella tundrae TaxID=227605 RepID=UPI00141B8CB0|nr:hypothetical protein [Methylocella tundrae]